MSTLRLVSVQEAAVYAKKTETTIWRWFKIGALTQYRVDINHSRVDLDEIDTLITPVVVARESGAS